MHPFVISVSSHTVLSVSCSLVVTCLERAHLFDVLYVMFSCVFATFLYCVLGQGPISSTSLRRVFVLKTSYEVRTLKIGFHQTIELCELLTFCRIFKTTI